MRIAALEEQKRQEEQARIAALEEQKRQEEQMRIAALEELRQEEQTRVAALEEQRHRDEQARIAGLEEQKRRDGQARIAAQEEQKRREEQARIGALGATQERVVAQHPAAGFAAQRVGVGRRVALVVGNSNYKVASISLPSPRNDAEDISAVLNRELGFEVVTAINATKRDMEAKLQQFARLAIDADSALFYYAGHAMQYQGRNYLMPTDAELEDEFSVRYETVSMDAVGAALERVNGVKIVILDASRNNPLANSLQTRIVGASRSRYAAMPLGLARIDRTEGMVVAYASAPDDVANDGQGRNSPFTAALLKRLQEPGLEIGAMFRRVAAEVMVQTRGRQRPETTINLLSEYYLNQNDRIAWGRLNQDDVAALRDFVSKYASSPLAIQASNRADLLERARIAALEEPKRREEQARAAEEQRRRDEQGRIAEEQKRREDQARLAEEQKRREDQARLAALEEQKRQEEQKHIAALPPASTTPPGPTMLSPATKTNLPEQIRQAQTELKRLGCFEGKLDGKMDTTEKAIKAFWKRSNKPVVEIDITDDFIADLQRHHDDFCMPGRPPVVAIRPVSPAAKPAARSAARPPSPAAAQPAQATASSPASSQKPRSTGVGF
jgi:uncharacterized caspase-like protein